MRSKKLCLLLIIVLVFSFSIPFLHSSVVLATNGWTASTGFSSTQGANNWRYQYCTAGGSDYTDMPKYDTTYNHWQRNDMVEPWVNSSRQHPGNNNYDSVRTFIAPDAGILRITGTAKKYDTGGGNGVRVRIFKNGTQIWPSSGWVTIAYNDSTGCSHDVITSVSANDNIYFIVNCNGEYSYDNVSWDPTLTYCGTSSNLVPNGSFEYGTDGNASDWTEGPYHARSNDKAKSGNDSLKSTATSTCVTQTASIAVQPDTIYRISGWIYKNNSNGTAYIDMNDIQGECQIGVGVGLGGGQWTYCEGTWNSGSTTSIIMRCVTDNGPTDSIWFDDLQMVEVTPTPTATWDLYTGDTYVKLGACSNGPVIMELKNITEGWNWISSPRVFPLISRVDIGSTQYAPDWAYQNAAVDTSSGTKVTLTYASTTPSLVLKSIWWARTGNGPVEHWMNITNNTGSEVTIYQQESLNLIVKGDMNPTLWRFHKDSGQADGTGVYKSLLANGNSITADTNTANNWNASGFIPCIYLDSGSAHGLYIGWEWPHGRINTLASGFPVVTANVRAGLNTDFKTNINSGATFDVPSAYLGAYKGDTDDGSNIFKKWFFSYKAPSKLRTDTNEPLTQMDDQDLVRQHDVAAMGIQSLKWDYGWWSDVSDGSWKTLEGDWKLRNSGYITMLQNNGQSTMGGYGQLLHNNNLKYAVYFLMHDALSNDPDALSSTGTNAHPEWFTNWKITTGNCADLGNEACVYWIKQRLLSCLNSYNIDTYRSDFGPIAIQSDKVNNHKYSVDVPYWCAKGFYEILDYLYANKTGFRYESCASGGSLKDYATMTKAIYINNEDSANYNSLRKSFYDASYCLPSAQLQSPCNPDTFCSESSYYQGPGDKDYGMRSILMGAVSMGSWSGPVNGHLQFGLETYISEYYNMYNQKIKPLVRNANLYHILPRPDNVHWDGMEYYDPSTSNEIKGCVFLFKPSTTDGDTKTIYFKGLNPATTYTLEFEDRTAQNTTRTGAQLMNGFSVTMTGTAASEIIWIK